MAMAAAGKTIPGRGGVEDGSSCFSIGCFPGMGDRMSDRSPGIGARVTPVPLGGGLRHHENVGREFSRAPPALIMFLSALARAASLT